MNSHSVNTASIDTASIDTASGDIAADNAARDEKRQMLKSTSIIGGSSFLKVLFRIVQSKAVAMLVGPTGLGLLGVFNSTTNLAATIAGMGHGTSGVRQIAEKAAGDDPIALAKSVTVFRRVSLVFAALGAIVFFALRQPIAQLSFGNTQYANALGLLAFVPFLTVVSVAQLTLLRGMRHIGAVASANALGAAIGTFAGLPLLYFWGNEGIAPYLVVVALGNSLVSWWYVRRVVIKRVRVSWQETKELAQPLFTLGFVFMLSGMTTVATLYLIRVIVTRELGLDAAGLFEAASAISNVYVAFILGAMGSDFFPHLTAVANDHQRSGRLINDQLEIGLLLATPGLLAVIVLGPWLLQILYSADFVDAFVILRWQVLGTFLRVSTWAMGYLLLAKGQGKWFFLTELAINVTYLAAVVMGLYVSKAGLPSVGIAFVIANMVHFLLIFLCARHLIGFNFAPRSKFLLMIYIPVILLAFLISHLSGIAALVAGLLLLSGVAFYSLKSLYSMSSNRTAKAILRRVQNMVAKTRLRPG